MKKLLIACAIAMSATSYAQQVPTPATKEIWKPLPQFQATPTTTPNWYAIENENNPVYWQNVDATKLLICLKKGQSPKRIKRLVSKYGLIPTHHDCLHPEIINFFEYEFPNGKKDKLMMLIHEAKGNKYVEYIEPEAIIKSEVCSPNDPYNYPNSGWKQWANHNTGIDSAWCTVLSGGWGQWIGIIDNACDYTHPDIGVIYEYDFADSDPDVMPDATGTQTHGTHVTGIAGGKTNNGIGIAGVSNDTVYFAKAVKDGLVLFDNVAIVNAINDMAINCPKLRVISMSFGANVPTATIQSACDNAWAHNKLLIAASGNNGLNVTLYPANYSNVIAVGATGVNPSPPYNNTFASAYSNYGSKQEISAPGGNADGSMWEIYSTLPSNSYGYMSGTSMATPMVSGLASLMFDVRPTLTNSQARVILQQSVFDLGTTGWDMYYGYGMICGFCAVYNAQYSCDMPTGLTATSVTTTSALLSWTAISGGSSYNLQYKVVGAGSWTTIFSSTNSRLITGLTPNTHYVFQVQTICPSSVSVYGTTIGSFTTLVDHTGIANVDVNSDMNIFPNPSTGKFTFSFTKVNKGTQISVYNTIGQLVWYNNSEENTIIADLSNEPSGMYYAKIKSGELEVVKMILIAK